MLNQTDIDIIKDALKTRITCLNWSHASMKASLEIGIGNLEDLQNCADSIAKTEAVLLKMNEVKP
jgi:hypothetical protein